MSGMSDGLLLVDKPAGPTSHDVVEMVRRILGRRVGHTGTLDPGASGLLPLVVGRATRMAAYLPHTPKVYTGLLRLGVTTSTDDMSGDVLGRFEGSAPALDEVRSSAAELRGTILQVPPVFSAKKVAGRRLYRLAREGRAPALAPIRVEVFRFEIEPDADPWSFRFVAEVSAGTYIRALARDLGGKLGCGGALESLRRTAIGPMRLVSAIQIAHPEERSGEILRARTIPLESMPFEPVRARLEDPGGSKRFLAGLPVGVPPGFDGSGICVVFDPAGTLLGVAEVAGGTLRPRVVLEAAQARDGHPRET